MMTTTMMTTMMMTMTMMRMIMKRMIVTYSCHTSLETLPAKQTKPIRAVIQSSILILKYKMWLIHL